MKYIASLLALLMCLTPAQALEVQVDFSNALLTVRDGNKTLLTTSVVLPRGNYYPVPVSGTVTRAEMGPTWTPTANMHRDYPGRYKQVYGPYERGNAMGHCKVSINFNSNLSIMRAVRIHGNAQPADLGQRRSRSCIRIPDELCSALVDALSDRQAKVIFHR